MNRDPVDALTEAQLRKLVRGIRDILWRTREGDLDPDRQHDSDTIGYVAAALLAAGLHPDPAPRCPGCGSVLTTGQGFTECGGEGEGICPRAVFAFDADLARDPMVEWRAMQGDAPPPSAEQCRAIIDAHDAALPEETVRPDRPLTVDELNRMSAAKDDRAATVAALDEVARNLEADEEAREAYKAGLKGADEPVPVEPGRALVTTSEDGWAVATRGTDAVVATRHVDGRQTNLVRGHVEEGYAAIRWGVPVPDHVEREASTLLRAAKRDATTVSERFDAGNGRAYELTHTSGWERHDGKSTLSWTNAPRFGRSMVLGDGLYTPVYLSEKLGCDDARDIDAILMWLGERGYEVSRDEPQDIRPPPTKPRPGRTDEPAYLTVGFSGEACECAVSVVDRMIGWTVRLDGRLCTLVARKHDLLTVQPLVDDDERADNYEEDGDLLTVDLADGEEHTIHVF